MGPSIAQPSAERRRALRRLLLELETALASAAASASDASTATALADAVARVRAIDPAADWPNPEGTRARLPVGRFWEAALEAATRGTAGALADALGVLAPALSWTQNPNYRRRPPDGSFLDGYGYAVIAGPVDGPPALALDSRLALGVLALGPRTHYSLHAHPAVEIYYTLTPDGDWWRGAGPLLAIYLWWGDLATHARLA